MACAWYGMRQAATHDMQDAAQVATHCSRHKLEGQVDLKNRRYLCRNPAGCHSLASFGHVLHGRPLFCARHKALQVRAAPAAMLCRLAITCAHMARCLDAASAAAASGCERLRVACGS